MSQATALPPLEPAEADLPLRGDSFSGDHLEQHAEELARLLVTAAGRRESRRESRRFVGRVAENAALLRSARKILATAALRETTLSSDAEWLLDNFNVVEEQLREISDDLPPRYYRELPKLRDGAPRVYALAVELIVHTDSALDEQTILRFVRAFQRQAELSIGEVWAFPIMLRLGLVENLRRLAEQTLAARECRTQAAELIHVWCDSGECRFDSSSAHRCAPLVLELVEQLKELGPEHSHRLTELERRLAGHGFVAAEIIRQAHQLQATNQVSIGNVITSMRLISALDWMWFFEETNLAEQVLRNDPAGIYAQMDSSTRDRYRHVVENFAKQTKLSDVVVAEHAIELARQARQRPSEPVERRHVGYYLIDGGRAQLAQAVGCQPRFTQRWGTWSQQSACRCYLAGLLCLTLLIVGILAAAAWALGGTLAAAGIMACLAILPASEVAVGLLNLVVTHTWTPKRLPKMEFKHGVPETCSTIVIVPSLLTSRDEVDSLMQRLELHYLANSEPALRFALITDFTDAPCATMPDDEPLLKHAVEQIAALNRKYRDSQGGPFYLLHRGRRHNEAEGCWMGWERKRGKLVEFNRLLRGARDTTFEVLTGDLDSLLGAGGKARFRYVITLDADTQLPCGTTRRLIGAISHPLNWPRFDETGRLTGGYVILQPRIGLHLGSANRSWFSRIFANSPGIDPYATAASDVYQDLFGEGSFTGKGIYDLEAFERMLEGVFPENHILSHDLIEGCHARVGLASDIELVDGYPSRYDADAKRQHRWVRGDWQLLPWLLPWTPTERGWIRNRLSLLSRWKVVDNLRRSLVPLFTLLFLLVGWFAFPSLSLLWTAAGLLVFAFPLLTYLALTPRSWPRGITWGEYRRTWEKELRRQALQAALLVTLLPHRAVLLTDAVIRTLFRLLITRRRMLEWETAADTERRLSKSRWSEFVKMWYSPALAVALIALQSSENRVVAAPLVLAWLLAPLIAHLISLPLAPRSQNLNPDELQWLRGIARKTWTFFETYVTAIDNWLPPDNYQEYPGEKIAHRISPTNEGLYLVSALVAREFGYLSLHDLAEHWDRNLANWQSLPRLRGHFYNWYDTLTLQPLLPRYVSTVDSGNLLACFLTLRQGIDELRRRPLFGPDQQRGILDTIDGLRQSCELSHPRGARLVNPRLESLVSCLSELRSEWESAPAKFSEWQIRCQNQNRHAAALVVRLAELSEDRSFRKTEIAAQGGALVALLASVKSEFETLCPWAAVVQAAQLPDVVPPEWNALVEHLEQCRNLDALRGLSESSQVHLAHARQVWSLHAGESPEDLFTRLETAIRSGEEAACRLDERLDGLGRRFESLAQEMDFGFLYNTQRKLFSIGFNIEDGHLDRAHYDMLASEARLASYLAIAKGDVEYDHWFRLGRSVTEAAGQIGLLSWGGTMFEYLMPQLFHRSYQGSLLEQSCRMAVGRQREYGRQNQVPWGISESAFGALAANSDYHYRSFGAPGLGLKRGLAKDLVVSPYSTMLALEIEPRAAYENLRKLEQEGGLGPAGFYDALDYTPDRVPEGKRCQIVRCYMAHHQGMSLVALANLLLDGSIRRQFHAHPLGRVPELLLQERIPIASPVFQPHEIEAASATVPRIEDELVSRRLMGYQTAAPRTHLLSNTEYSVMLTSTGGGYSQCQETAISRWRSDATRDHYGQFIYLRDMRTGRVWSATYQPTRANPQAYEVIYSIDKAEYIRLDGLVETHLEVAVSPECNAEMRQLKITNHGSQLAEIEVTSYCEIVLTSPAADLAHPAFQKLFVETEYVAEENALLAHRRPRDAREPSRWGVHVLALGQPATGPVEYETSRQEFLGRLRSPATPHALDHGVHLSGATGAVLDPIFSLRCLVLVPPHKSVTVAFTTALATSREEALVLADQFHESRGVQRGFELAWAYSQVEIRHLHLSPAKAHLYQRLAAGLLYPDPTRRAAADVLLANRQGQNGLWRYGVSGDRPILLAHVTKPEQIDFVRDLLLAHQFWRTRGLQADLVILNDYPGSYVDALQDQLIGLLHELRHASEERPPNVYLLRTAQIPREDVVLLETTAWVVLHGERGTLGKQLETATAAPAELPLVTKSADTPLASQAKSAPRRQVYFASSPGKSPSPIPKAAPSLPECDASGNPLEFWNGWGGFANEGREYHIVASGVHRTPMPWINVIANPRFGCLISESGGGYTWAGNSREYKLTSWANDPVTDSPSEMLYIRDLETGKFWRPMQGLDNEAGRVRVEHGQGYTRFRLNAGAIESEVTISVATEDPIKFVSVNLKNHGRAPRHLSLTYFVEWVLGVCREHTQLHVRTSVDTVTGALCAANAYHPDYPSQVAFLHVLGAQVSWTGDRAEFIGRNEDLAAPDALSNGRLSGRTGAGLDPCGAVQCELTVSPGESRNVAFLLGAGVDSSEARLLVEKYSQPDEISKALEATKTQWDEILGALQVQTPNRALDLLVNRWLVYQVIGCRLWARSAFYQAGGAYGFRDQLQDVMAVVYARPDLARAQLLRAAARQFEEGDVQHWWHPPMGRGTRTRFSDDYLWLPLVAAHYISVTGDSGILEEALPFLQSPPLEPHEHERYETPAVSPNSGSLYEHCRRTLGRAFRLGPHGLPLIGCGDWNDGFNRVGELGQGESVWVGWFLLVILKRFLPLMQARGDGDFAAELAANADTLRQSLEREAWDGEWYRRAYFDNGDPLGSKQNDECQIDSLAQTWAALADAKEDRVRQAMEAVWERLVRKDDQLVLLFTPPFDKSAQDPGYIKGYLPGTRENGGQYTHSALWVVQALAKLGDSARAMEVFDLINPIHHADSPAGVQRYQVEPYVVAADVYGLAPHTGRGGWSWYTGSASWMYRVAIESILGLVLEGSRLRMTPCIPAAWPRFELTLKRGAATVHIVVLNDGGEQQAQPQMTLDGVACSGLDVELPATGRHELVVRHTGS